jgi:hypothetical protein
VKDELTIIDVIDHVIEGVNETLHFDAILGDSQVALDEIAKNDTNLDDTGFMVA